MDFITAEEKVLLTEKLSELRAMDKVLIQRIAEARALGDLRENAEYHASREDKAMNDAKIKDLEERLARAQVADSSALPLDMVFVGAVVRLQYWFFRGFFAGPIGRWAGRLRARWTSEPIFSQVFFRLTAPWAWFRPRRQWRRSQ